MQIQVISSGFSERWVTIDRRLEREGNNYERRLIFTSSDREGIVFVHKYDK